MLINIALAADEAYFIHARVMLCSLFENNRQHQFAVYLFTEADEHPELCKISKLVSRYEHKLNLVKVNKALFQNFYTSGHISIATYYRLLIPTLLPPEVEKVLYLDTDLIIKKDIGELWNTPLLQHCIAAVDEKNRDHVERLGLPGVDAYFNAGVLLINTNQWKELDIAYRGLEIAETYKEKLITYDQDVLNILLAERWVALPQRWNQTEGERLGYLYEEPTIIHFVGKKPWTIHCIHPYKKDYYFYYYKMEGFSQKVIDISWRLVRAIRNRLPLKLS